MAIDQQVIFSVETGEAAKSLKELRDNINSYKDDLLALRGDQEKYDAVLQKIAESQQALNKINEDVKRTMRERTNATRQETAEFRVHEKSIVAIRNRLHEMRQAYDRLNPDGKVARGLLEEINTVDAALSRLEQNSGRFQRNVGNYSSAFNGLGNSVNQIARELPAAAMGFNTFFLAISNNIPQLVDEINRMNVANRAAAAQGQATTSVMDGLRKAVFSWNTVIVLAVTALTMFGDKLVEAIKGLDMFGAAQRNANKTMNEGLINAAGEATELHTLYAITQDVTRSMEDRNKAADTLQAMAPKTFENLSNEEILTGKAAAAYKDLADSMAETARNSILLERLQALNREKAELQLKIEGAPDSLTFGEEISKWASDKWGNEEEGRTFVQRLDKQMKKLDADIEATRALFTPNTKATNAEADKAAEAATKREEKVAKASADAKAKAAKAAQTQAAKERADLLKLLEGDGNAEVELFKNTNERVAKEEDQARQEKIKKQEELFQIQMKGSQEYAQWQEEQAEKEKERLKQIEEAKVQLMLDGLNGMADIYGALSDLYATDYKNREIALKQKMQGLDKESAAFAKYERELEKLNREAFEANKKRQIAQAVLDSIAGQLSAFLSGVGSSIPFPWNMISGGAAATQVAVMSALQIANLRKQKYDGGSSSSSSLGGSSMAVSAPMIPQMPEKLDPIQEAIYDTRGYEEDMINKHVPVLVVESLNEVQGRMQVAVNESRF